MKRRYTVNLKRDGANALVIKVEADDVNVEAVDGPTTAFWNFTMAIDESDVITVAALPFATVDYITSEAEPQ